MKKKPEITITIEFTDNVNINKFKECFLNDDSLKNCKAETIILKQIKNNIVLDFYGVENKRQILKYKKLLLSIADCINTSIFMLARKHTLLALLHNLESDEEGMNKKFKDLSRNYKNFVNHV